MLVLKMLTFLKKKTMHRNYLLRIKNETFLAGMTKDKQKVKSSHFWNKNFDKRYPYNILRHFK